MTKFKAGDVVERTVTDVYCGLPSGEQGVVSKAVGNLVWIKGYGDWCHLAESLRLAEQDDPLPPAPESALYVNNWRWGVEVRNLGDVVRIGTGDPDSCNYGWVYATLDPDSALQLAHDLNRMANEIKRREKRQERKTTLSPAIAHPYGE